MRARRQGEGNTLPAPPAPPALPHLVQPRRDAVDRLQHGAPGPQPHGPPLVRRRAFGHEDDDRVLRRGVEFSARRPLQPQHVARVLDDGQLHAQANAEVGDARGAGVVGGEDLALDAARAKAARHEDAVGPFQRRPRLLPALLPRLQLLGVDPGEVQLAVGGEAGVLQSFDDAQVRVGEPRVLAHHGDRHRRPQRVPPFRQLRPPGREVHGRSAGEAEVRADRGVRALGGEQQGDVPDVGDVVHGEHVAGRDLGAEGWGCGRGAPRSRGGPSPPLPPPSPIPDLAKQGQLVAHPVIQRLRAPAREERGVDAERAQRRDRVLRRLGFLFADDAQNRYERHVH